MHDEKSAAPSKLVILCVVIFLSCVLLLVGWNLAQKRNAREQLSAAQSGMLSTDLRPDDVSDYLFSNGYVATGEWESYQRSYDPDGSKLEQAMGSEEIGQGYTLYRVYTSEMAAKLDALTKARQLQLNRSMSFCYSVEELYAAAHTGACLEPDSSCVGYIFDGGSFHFDGLFRDISYRFDLQKKDCFSETRLLTPTHEDEQWVYISHGQPLILSLGSEHCLIHTALQNAYLTVTLPYPAADAEGHGVSGVLLEALADSIYWERIEG